VRKEPEHQTVREERQKSIAAHKTLEAKRHEHARNLQAKPPATSGEDFLRYSRNVQEAAAALRLIGQEVHADELDVLARRLMYCSL
jgi:hypothetical protein